MRTALLRLEKGYFNVALITPFCIFWLYCFAFAIDYTDWWLENILVFAGVGWLLIPANRKSFSRTGLVFIFLFLCLHVYGAKMAYTMNELGEYFQNSFGLTRNPYDRIVHFSFGFLLLFPMYEYLSVRLPVNRRTAIIVANMAVLCLAAIFELIEWGVAAFTDSATGESYVATQGDVWDAQKDIALALVGALLMSGIKGHRSVIACSLTSIRRMFCKRFPGIILFAMLAFASCRTPKYIYTPPTANLLKLEKRGDAQVAVNYSLAGTLRIFRQARSRGIDFQGAYALTDRIGIKADFYTKNESNQSGLSVDNIPFESLRYKKRGGELSGGVYNFSRGLKKDGLAVYGGLGWGESSFSSTQIQPDASYVYDAAYRKAFLQASYSFNLLPNYLLAFAGKVSAVKFHHVVTDYPDLQEEPLVYIDTKTGIFTDFIFHNEFGFAKLPVVKFQWQIGITALQTRFGPPELADSDGGRYEHNRIWFAVGAIADIKKLFNK